MDVEGAEIDILSGSAALIARFRNLKIAACTFHRQNDAEDIGGIMEKYQFTSEFSSGYMLFLHSKMIPLYFRRGLIRTLKK